MQYHRDSHEELKVSCELCGFKSSSESNLTKHILVQSKGSTSGTQQHQCEVGDLNFSNYSNYKRHRREKHYDFKANLDFVEDMDAFKLVECIKCTKTFKRMSDLKCSWVSRKDCSMQLMWKSVYKKIRIEATCEKCSQARFVIQVVLSHFPFVLIKLYLKTFCVNWNRIYHFIWSVFSKF